MEPARFVYVTYIAGKREQVWEALLQPEFTRRYWKAENLSDWRVGSRWEHRLIEPAPRTKLVGKVIESARPERLVISWGFPADESNEAGQSRVTFQLVQVEAMVQLTVTHDRLVPDSEMDRGIRIGWPRVLSSLKSMLETGTPLDTWAGK